MFPVDSGVVDAGVQFVQVSKAAAQHSRGRVSMARRNVRYLVQTIRNGAPWLSHFPRTLQALSEEKPPLETSAHLFQKSELLDSYRLDFRRVRSHFSLRARNHPVHQHVHLDWALFVPSSGGLLIANSFGITHSLGFFLDCWDEQCLDLSCWPNECSTTPREKIDVRPWQCLFMLISFFSFSRSRYDQRGSSRTCMYKLLDKSIVRSSPLIESLKKMKCTDTSGDRYHWTLKKQRQYCLGERRTSGRGGHGRRATETSQLRALWILPTAQERRERQSTILVELWRLR